MNWYRWLMVGICAAALVALLTFRAWTYWNEPDHAAEAAKKYGYYTCVQVGGDLPGGATGKRYYVIGTYDAGRVSPYDGQVHDAGEMVFTGYCGPDGEAR